MQLLPTSMDTLPTEELIICEIVFCRLSTRSVNIVTEMPIAENNIHYSDVTENHLINGTLHEILGPSQEKGTKGNLTVKINLEKTVYVAVLSLECRAKS
jgi:hypothetical protein